MTKDENFNTMHARIVCSTDDDNDNVHHAPTAFNYASNANNISNTSIVLVTFPLLNIRDQHENEDFIVPDGHANPLPEGFSHVAPSLEPLLILADMLTLPLLHPPRKTTPAFL
jgi:hypothetical protein